MHNFSSQVLKKTLNKSGEMALLAQSVVFSPSVLTNRVQFLVKSKYINAMFHFPPF